MHIYSNPIQAFDDYSPWSTSNGWALWGITRVLATLIHWKPSRQNPWHPLPYELRKAELVLYATEIIDAAIRTDDHESGLLRNYWSNTSYSGETSGMTLITAAVYRLAALDEGSFGRYLIWAEKKKKIVGACIGRDGVVGPAANALNYLDAKPLKGGSAEGQAFMLELIAASRDWDIMKGRS